MRNVLRLLPALIVTVPCFLSVPAYAQLDVFGAYGGAPLLLGGGTDVRMDLQDVIIRLKKESFTVDAVFHFFNTEGTTTESVAFGRRPVFKRHDIWVNGRDPDELQLPWFWRFFRFLREIFPPSQSREEYLVYPITFPGHERTTIRVSYEQANHGRYDFGTARYWQGNIGVASITIDGSEIGGRRSFWVGCLPNWQWLETDNAVRLDACDFEPHCPDIVYFTVLHRASVSDQLQDNPMRISGPPLLMQSGNAGSGPTTAHGVSKKRLVEGSEKRSHLYLTHFRMR